MLAASLGKAGRTEDEVLRIYEESNEVRSHILPTTDLRLTLRELI